MWMLRIIFRSLMVCYFNLEVDGSMRGWLVVGDTVVLRWAGTKVLVRIAVLVTCWAELYSTFLPNKASSP